MMLRPLALAAALAATSAAAQEVKVGVAAEPYPPFTYLDASGEWIGWEIEFMNAVCAEAGLTCVIEPVAWDGIIPALTSGKIDMIVGSMSITADRMQTISFTDKYYNTPTSIIAATGSGLEPTNESLSGMVLGVQVATVHAAYANHHFPDATIREYQTQDEANNDLASGRLDAVQADAIALADFLATDQGACCEIIGNVADDADILGAGVGIGVRQEDNELRERLNAAIAAIRENGTYDAFSAEWFDFDIYGG